jgi:hypothetical protein
MAAVLAQALDGVLVALKHLSHLSPGHLGEHHESAAVKLQLALEQ